MRKIFLIFILSLALIHPANAESLFSDVFDSHLNSSAIQYLFEEGIVEGYGDGTYRPDRTINRVEFTKIVLGAVTTVDDLDTSLRDLALTDLEVGAWYIPYIREGMTRAMIEGYPDKTFRPANEINFVEAAKIITIAFDLTLIEADIWYEPYVEALENKGAVPESIQAFDQFITRGEMSEIIYRLRAEIIGETPEENGDPETPEETWAHFALNHINGIRAEHEKPPLVMNERLNAIAMAHSKDMAEVGELSHEGSLGETADERIRQGKVPDSETHTFTTLPVPENIGWSGENVGFRGSTYGGETVQDSIVSIHGLFMDEPVDEYNHRTTMLSTLIPFNEIGVGIYLDDDGVVWITEDFISR